MFYCLVNLHALTVKTFDLFGAISLIVMLIEKYDLNQWMGP